MRRFVRARAWQRGRETRGESRAQREAFLVPAPRTILRLLGVKLNLIGTLQKGKSHKLRTDRSRIGAYVSLTRKRGLLRRFVPPMTRE